MENSARTTRFLAAVPVVGPALARLVASASRMERATVALVLFVAVTLYAFAKVADEVIEGDTTVFDRDILLALRNPADPSDPIGPVWFEEVMRDFTALGGTAVLCLVVLCALAFLLLTRKRGTALLVACSMLGATVLSSVLKWGFDRPRPDLVPHGVAVYTASFPSSHAMLSAAVYLTLGALLARSQARVRVKIFLLGVAVFVTLLIGVSRIYLGVHWPTDVLGGWMMGAAWAALSWLVMLYLQRRGEVEGEADGGAAAPSAGRSA